MQLMRSELEEMTGDEVKGLVVAQVRQSLVDHGKDWVLSKLCWKMKMMGMGNVEAERQKIIVQF